MYLRLSTALAARIKQPLKEALPLQADYLEDWSAHCFHAGHTQFVLLTNTATLYSTIFAARGITTAARLIEAGRNSLQECLAADGLPSLSQRVLALDPSSVRFSKALNRSVTGSMNDLIRHAKYQLAERQRYPHEAAALLNTIPFAALDYRLPREAMAAAAGLFMEPRSLVDCFRPAKILQFKVQLRDCEPPLWRRIQIADGTLDELHECIQLAMGWTNSHLHQFEIGGTLYGDPQLLEEGFQEMGMRDSTRTRLGSFLPEDGKPFAFDYEYDFGDSWDHEVLFEGYPPVDPNSTYPLCLEGAGACPPEDVGGTSRRRCRSLCRRAWCRGCLRRNEQRFVVVAAEGAGEMPPKKEPQPKSAELGTVVDWLSTRLHEGEAARMARRGPVTHYRLSREEYGHTVYDLLGVYFDVNMPGALNEDPRWHGLNRIGSLLSLSPSHVDRYFQAAETVLARAFPDQPPQSQHSRREANAISEVHQPRH